MTKNKPKKTDIEIVNEIYDFLQGKIPGEILLAPGNESALNESQAWSVIWFLQEHMDILPSNIEKCDSCGYLFDENEGGYYCEKHCEHYCDGCLHLAPDDCDPGG